MEKKKILFYSKKTGGVYYHRILMPALGIDKFGLDYHVEINPDIDFNDKKINKYLSGFDIIYYTAELFPSMEKLCDFKGMYKNVKLILDIDDYWVFNNMGTRGNKYREYIEFNLKVADFVTTTTEYLANKIRGVRGDENVVVLPNAINVDLMPQFVNNRKVDENVVRIGYLGGSTHVDDVELLSGVSNMIFSDTELRDKVKFILCGWDDRGVIPETMFNQELGNILQSMNLLTNTVLQKINKSKGDIDKISEIPIEIRDRFRDKMFITKKRAIKIEESPYYKYEQVFTDSYRIIKDKKYLNWLMQFDKHRKYDGNESRYGRRWSLEYNEYATMLDECDILLAPLVDTEFNRCKSNLKLIEGMSRKIPVVCSDVIPYNVDIVDGHNGFLIPNKKKTTKYWYKTLKKLILDGDLRNKIGEQLHNDLSDKFDLINVTKKRIGLFESLVN